MQIPASSKKKARPERFCLSFEQEISDAQPLEQIRRARASFRNAVDCEVKSKQ